MWPANIFSPPLSRPFHKKVVPTIPQNPVFLSTSVAITKTARVTQRTPETPWSHGTGRVQGCRQLSPVSFGNLLKQRLLLGAFLTARRNPFSDRRPGETLSLLLFSPPDSFWLFPKHSSIPDTLPDQTVSDRKASMLLTARWPALEI